MSIENNIQKINFCHLESLRRILELQTWGGNHPHLGGWMPATSVKSILCAIVISGAEQTVNSNVGSGLAPALTLEF